MPNLRANFEVKTSRGGSTHDLYWCEIFEGFTNFSNAEISLRDLHSFIYLPFKNVIFYIRSVLYSFLTVLSALNLLINASYFNLTNKNILYVP